MGLWLSWRDVPCQSLTDAEYSALLPLLRDYRDQDIKRVVRDMIDMRGPNATTSQRRLDQLELGGGEAPRNLRVEDSTWIRQHPWQCEPGLPNAVTVDCKSNAPVLLSTPPRPDWILMQRNGRLLIRNPVGVTCQTSRKRRKLACWNSAIRGPSGATACQLNPWLGVDNRSRRSNT
jgi:hypothetical protein